jgi:hypothetical protein
LLAIWRLLLLDNCWQFSIILSINKQWQFDNHVLLNNCWQLGFSLSLNARWQFGDSLLLNIRWQIWQPLIALTEMIELAAFIRLEGVNYVFSHVSLILVATFIF